MSESLKQKQSRILDAAELAVDELIKVLKEPIIRNAEEDITADKMKNAASAKKLAFLDAMEILDKIQEIRDRADETIINIPDTTKGGWAENAAKNNKKK
jgi:hypothetical protein